MKTIILCSFVLSTAAFAQEARPGRMVSLDVGHFIYSLVPPSSSVVIPLEFEGAISPMVSLFVAPRLAIGSGVMGFGLSAGARFYLLNGPAVSGLWLGPEFGILYGATTPSSISGNWAFSLGAGLGYNFIVGNSLVISPGVRVGIGGLGSSTLVLDFSPRLVLGYAF
jgi:hypothetical protein